MARFYARFDSGGLAGANWISGLDSDFFERRRIGLDSASAALLRNGLIVSRSILSTDIYEDLDNVNKDGSRGTYFPPDSGPFSTNSSTFVSWSTAYTSSVPGIKTPTVNTYDPFNGTVNYSLRPTSSVLSTMTNLVTESSPLDPVGVSYNTYISASNAVRAVLNVVQNGAGTLNSPYTRTGNNHSRTLHSIWYDPDLQYFAWDDFTPSQPIITATSFYSSNTTTSSVGYIRIAFTSSFLNDFNPFASCSITATLRFASSSEQEYRSPPNVATAASLTTSSTMINFSDGATSFIKYFDWYAGAIAKAAGTLDGESSDGLMLSASVTFFDRIITSSAGTPGRVIRTTGATCTVNGIGSNNCFIKLGST